MSSNDDEKKQFPHASKQGSFEQDGVEEHKADKQPDMPAYVYETQHKHTHEQKISQTKADEHPAHHDDAGKSLAHADAHKHPTHRDGAHKQPEHDNAAHSNVRDHSATKNADAHKQPAHDDAYKQPAHDDAHKQPAHDNAQIKSAHSTHHHKVEHAHSKSHSAITKEQASHPVNEGVALENDDEKKNGADHHQSSHNQTLKSDDKEAKSHEANPHENKADENKANTNKSEEKKPKSKRKRSGIIRNPFIILANFALTAIVIVAIICVVHFYTDRAAFEEPGPNPTTKTVLIRPGAGVGEIATILERENIITRSQAFKNGVSYYDQTNKLKAGEYEIPAFASMHQAMDIITSGKSIEYSLTIPEGLTVQQAIYRIRDNDVLTGDLPTTLPQEGALLADTVRFTRGTTRKEIIRRLQDGQQKLVQSIWEKRSPDTPVKTINEFVTLASIVEKETGIAAERPMVAGVFTNRLKQDMRLDSDPTFLYGIYGGEGKPVGKAVTRDDRLSDTPYNTYRMKGLPPTPIAIPGRDALEAVANPAKTDALFFVADGTGGHIFANTLEEHNNNVAKWRQFRSSQSNGQPNEQSTGQ